ncbi:MAG TPA: CoA pyrophosphatase [Candidatus Eisenbacteria bacterium]|nr:CoA pyrophosphatase [Candidatus Eisenbacteria bacterium]
MRSVDDIRAALAAHAPRVLIGRQRAAVAIVLHEGAAGAEMLFIERAERFGDPWSGQMAFPGGRMDPGDADERAAAERETLEEVGLDLAGAERLGRLDDLHAGIRLVAPLVLSPFVYRIDARPALTPNHEVRETLWVPLRTLSDPAHHVDHRWALSRFPGILVGEPGRHVVWGLTYQVLEGLYGIAGVALRRSAG